MPWKLKAIHKSSFTKSKISGDVWLYGFLPNETVQLLRYDVSEREYRSTGTVGHTTEIYSLVGQQIISADKDGTKVISDFAPKGQHPEYQKWSYIVAVGDESGEAGLPQGWFVEESVLLDE